MNTVVLRRKHERDDSSRPGKPNIVSTPELAGLAQGGLARSDDVHIARRIGPKIHAEAVLKPARCGDRLAHTLRCLSCVSQLRCARVAVDILDTARDPD